MKIKKLIPIMLSVAILIGITAVSSFRKAVSPSVSKTVSTIDETDNSTKDEAKKTEFEEMRGVWISYIELSMEKESDKSEEAFRKKFDKIAENSKGYGLNTLIVQVRPYGDALYKSEYYPWSHILTGTQGKNPGYDPLKIMCEISRKYGMQIHAWVNPYRITLNETPGELSDDNPYVKNKNLGLTTGSGIILDPSNKKARELITKGVVEIVKNYDIDGIQFDDYFYPEIIDPKTLEPVRDGETGELVFTTLTKEGIPLIRYRTKDLTSITHERCECGRTSARISRFKGRSDDMLIIRGVNVFPSQVEAALVDVEEVTPHYMMIVDRENNLDSLEIQVEVDVKYYTDEIRGIEKLTKKIAGVIQGALGISAKIKLMGPNSLPRSEGKAVHVIDNRKLY